MSVSVNKEENFEVWDSQPWLRFTDSEDLSSYDHNYQLKLVFGVVNYVTPRACKLHHVACDSDYHVI